MKKAYQTPSTEVYKVLAKTAMLAGSGESMTFNSNNESGTGTLNEEVASGPALGRVSIWGDDEEE